MAFALLSQLAAQAPANNVPTPKNPCSCPRYMVTGSARCDPGCSGEYLYEGGWVIDDNNCEQLEPNNSCGNGDCVGDGLYVCDGEKPNAQHKKDLVSLHRQISVPTDAVQLVMEPACTGGLFPVGSL